jgi:hypothetical protein
MNVRSCGAASNAAHSVSNRDMGISTAIASTAPQNIAGAYNAEQLTVRHVPS